MTWDAATDLDDVSFLQAVDWFAQRVPITDEEFTRDVEQARRQAFWIAGVTQAQVIRDVHRSLKRALDKGVPFEEWQKEIGPELERAWGGYLPSGEAQAHRTELVMRNWAQHSYSRARWNQMNEPVIRRLRPYRMFDAVRPTPDPTPVCTAWNGVVLPADHPAWETHNPPLHHGCQSGIRALTERKAKALGIRNEPPELKPDEGWGTHDEWKGPDKRTFPKEVKPPPPPPPPPPAQSPLRRRAQEISDALDSGDHGRARDVLREAIEHQFPGTRSKDVEWNRPGVDRYEVLQDQRDGGYHGWDGKIALGENGWRRGKNGIRRVAAGDLDSAELRWGASESTNDLIGDLDYFTTFIHEEIHGFSRIRPHDYRGAAAVLEEVGTELASRRVLHSLVPGLEALMIRGSYAADIRRVADIVMRHTGLSRSQSVELLTDAHIGRIMADKGEISSGFQYLVEVVEGLAVTPAQRSAILDEFKFLEATHLPESHRKS